MVTNRDDHYDIITDPKPHLEVDAALVLPLEDDVGRLLVHPDAEPLELGLQDLLVAERLQHVQHDEDEVGGASHGDNLEDGGVWERDLEEVRKGDSEDPSPVFHDPCRPWLLQ